jgi:type VI protein secretion system component Hcp
VSPSPFLTVVLTDAVIEKFKIDGQNDGTQRASFWFAYERIEWKVN